MTTAAPVAQAPPRHIPGGRPRSPSLEKYRRVEKPRESTPDDEIRVMGTGRVTKYVTYATKLLKEQEKTALTIRATGKAVSIAVSVCEAIKRRFKGLHQLTSIGWMEIIDEYEPLEDGLLPRAEKRIVPSISIFLTKDETAVDKTAVGYQPPLDEPFPQDHQDSESYTGQAPRRRNINRKRNPRRPQQIPPVAGEEGQSELTQPKATDVPRGDSSGQRKGPKRRNDRKNLHRGSRNLATTGTGASGEQNSTNVPVPTVVNDARPAPGMAPH